MTGIAVSGVPGGLPAWQGLSTKFLPPGTYRVSAQAEVNTSEPGPQASFTVAEEPIAVNETIRSVSNTSRDYLFTLEPPGAPVVLSNQSVFWNGSGSGILPIDWTYLVNWTGPGVLSTQGALLSPAASERVVSVSIVQLTAT